MTFMRDALAKWGVRFEKLAIDEYKNAFDNLVRQEMSPHHREQLEALLARFEAHYVESIGAGRRPGSRGRARPRRRGHHLRGPARRRPGSWTGSPTRTRSSAPITGCSMRSTASSPRPCRRCGAGGSRISRSRATSSPASRGASRRRSAGRWPARRPWCAPCGGPRGDASTRAVVLFVDSSGGSALASDLIGREVRRLAEVKPVVAVMGAVAASGGYYVLTHANRVIAAPDHHHGVDRRAHREARR